MSRKDEKNVSCHYWLLHIDFKYFGFQTLGENMVYNQQCYMNRWALSGSVMDRQVERQMVAAIDKWHGLTMQDIRKLEDENMAALKEKIKSKEIAMALLLGRGGHA